MSCPITGKQICECTLKEKLRKLFTDHAVYTKFYIESSLQNTPDLPSITARLLDNQVDIGNITKPIIGNENGDKLSSLLKEHILAAAGALNALKAKQGLSDAVSKVFANSKLVSEFLSKLSPKLPYETVLKEFNQHNQYVLDIATLHSQGKYDQEVKLYDAYYNHMLMFSDMLHNALNPNKQIGGSNYKYAKYKTKYQKLKNQFYTKSLVQQ